MLGESVEAGAIMAEGQAELMMRKWTRCCEMDMVEKANCLDSHQHVPLNGTRLGRGAGNANRW